jgi:hypothetical protein
MSLACVLSLIDAGLGRKEEALQEGRRAVELLPVKRDAIFGPVMIEYLSVNGKTYTREAISPLKAVPNYRHFRKAESFRGRFELLCLASTSGELCDKVSAL